MTLDNNWIFNRELEFKQIQLFCTLPENIEYAILYMSKFSFIISDLKPLKVSSSII